MGDPPPLPRPFQAGEKLTAAMVRLRLQQIRGLCIAGQQAHLISTELRYLADVIDQSYPRSG